MHGERPSYHESLPPYPYNVPGLSAAAFSTVVERVRHYQQRENVSPIPDALIHQWCWEARLAERGTIPIAPSRQHLPVDTQRPRVEYIATANGYLPKLVFPTVQEIHPRRNTGESERALSETMAVAGHAYYTLIKTAMQHPELSPEYLATVNDFALALHQALGASARAGDMASFSLPMPCEEHRDLGEVVSQALLVPGSPRLYMPDNALPASLSEQYFQQSIIPDVFIDTRRHSYAPDVYPLRRLAGYNTVPSQVQSYFSRNA